MSNSLPCLLAFAHGSLDLSVEHYGAVAGSIAKGLEAYTRNLPTTVGPVRLTYFHNLAWDGDNLSDVPKVCVDRDLSSYDAYRRFLDETMERLASNARAPDRREPFQLIATLSSGYDSPTATVLATQVGCREAFGFDRARGDHDDSGAPIAKVLGLQYHAVETTAWRRQPMAAVPFLAALASSGSSVPFKGAEALLAGRVVFTGFHGDKVWDRETQALGPEIVRSDASGTDLTEYRLWVGFVDCPVPYFGVRQIKDIHAISTSPDLAPWNVKGGYNRPICRRIVEERGVPREIFGVKKKATAQFILREDDFLTADMRLDYYRWMRSQRQTGISRGQKPPGRLTDMRVLARARVAVLAERALRNDAVKRLGPRAQAILTRLSAGLDSTTGRAHHQYVFHWAVDRAKERYRDPRPLGTTARPAGWQR